MAAKKKSKPAEEISQLDIENEHRIRNAFKDKDWSEIKSADSWVIFKVVAEFVEGFEKLAKIGPCVTIFGSARTKSNSPHYKTAEEIAFQLVQNGYGVITGGGPGIMEAGNRGASWQFPARKPRSGISAVPVFSYAAEKALPSPGFLRIASAGGGRRWA